MYTGMGLINHCTTHAHPCNLNSGNRSEMNLIGFQLLCLTEKKHVNLVNS